MKNRARALLGTFVFFWIAPAMVGGWVPYAITGWKARPPLLGLLVERLVGVVLVAGGLAVLVECFGRFALEGRGTPAPVAPTETLVVSGLYRYVRNPMYLGVLAAVTGQALLFGSAALMTYGAVLWLLFHAFVVGYEEQALGRRFGLSYEAYRRQVRRWWPRLAAWRPPAP